MSNIIHKVKDAVTGHSHSHPNDPNTPSSNHGPHNTNVGNKVDPRVDSDLDGRAGTGKYTSASNAGPHDSNVANKLDPRVDSDRDHSATVGQGGLPTTHGHTTTGTTGGIGSTTAGPHNSNLLNKADPRVDSDRDGSRNYGAATGATGASAYGNTGYSGTGTGSTHTAGPHNSDVLNKVDPRVDSDRDGSRNFGAATGNTGASAYGSTGTTHGSGLTGTHGSSGLTGTHGSSGLTGTTHGTTHGHSGLTSGPGPAPNTAGPHGSDMLNKVDPRVDSDRDGSSTLGGNRTNY